jgi:hypothetical protein
MHSDRFPGPKQRRLPCGETVRKLEFPQIYLRGRKGAPLGVPYSTPSLGHVHKQLVQ